MMKWRHGDNETWTWRHGAMQTWTHGHMDTWRRGHMETWRHRHGDMDTETWAWRHGCGDMELKYRGILKFFEKIWWETEKGKPSRQFFLIRLPFACHANGNLPFLLWLAKKQTENIRSQTNQKNLPICSMNIGSSAQRRFNTLALSFYGF